MDKYLSAKDLLGRWGIRSIQLFNLCKKGELKPYNWREEKIITLDSFKGTKEFKEFISKRKQELRLIEKGKERAGRVLTEPGIYTRVEPTTDKELEKRATQDFRPEGCELYNYSLPADDAKAKQKLKKFLDFNFKESDIKRYEIEHGLFDPDEDLEEIENQNASFIDIGDKTTRVTSNKSIKKEILPCKPGAQWKDVTITRISYDATKVETPQGSERYTFSELGMSDKRSGDRPTSLWNLLMYFCEYSGRVTSETRIDGIQNLAKARSDLNKKLQKIFGIHENFCYTYNKKDGWRAKCIFDDKIEV